MQCYINNNIDKNNFSDRPNDNTCICLKKKYKGTEYVSNSISHNLHII